MFYFIPKILFKFHFCPYNLAKVDGRTKYRSFKFQGTKKVTSLNLKDKNIILTMFRNKNNILTKEMR